MSNKAGAQHINMWAAEGETVHKGNTDLVQRVDDKAVFVVSSARVLAVVMAEAAQSMMANGVAAAAHKRVTNGQAAMMNE